MYTTWSNFTIGKILQLPQEILLGLIIVGSCPGGTASNVMVYLARAHLPVSITLTLISTILAPILTPLWIYFLAHKYIDISFLSLLKTTFWIVVFPLFDGLIIRKFFKKRIEPIIDIFPSISIIAILIGVMLACNRWMLMGQVIIYRYIENSPTSLSYVALAMLLIFFCSLIIDSITHSSLPVISRLYQNHKKINKKILYNTLIAIIPIGLTIVILGKFIIPYLTALIFGANYYIAGDLFASLLWVLIPYSMSHITAQIFIIKNKVLTLASAAFISALLMTLVLPFAINIIGIYSGILYTTFIAFSLQFFILLFVNFKNE